MALSTIQSLASLASFAPALRGRAVAEVPLSMSPGTSDRIHASRMDSTSYAFGSHPPVASLDSRHSLFTSGTSCLKKYASNASSRCRMSFSGGSGPDIFPYDDEEYVEAHVVDAVRMMPSHGHLFMTMSNGSKVEVEHVNPSAGRLLCTAATPTIFLKMADGSGLMLPIIVGEAAVGQLFRGFNRESPVRPGHYDLIKNMVESLHYEIRVVKITQRVADTYYARIYLAQPNSDALVSVDARPSDALNVAVRSQVPIFVSKSIISHDAIRVRFDLARSGVEGGTNSMNGVAGGGDTSSDFIIQEISLLKSMMAAADEERYADAARIRDELNTLRSSSRRQLNKH